ncbi:DUF1801 domain-containing protein [Microbacterium sp. RD1]|uniref:DUF1801 domain-containing protein n=1 Tax=Microbacterium sp. RD1 TaxID=3457313 RepID=UPI003FA54C48
MDVPPEVQAFVDRVEPARRRRDAQTLLDLFGHATGQTPTLWGSIIGFGSYHYRYESGREGDTAAVSFAPRKAATTIYLVDGIGAHAAALERLGPHTTGVGCLYIKDAEQIDLDLLADVIGASYREVTAPARDGEHG